MANQEIIRQLKSYLKKIQKEQKITPVKVRTIIRVKSLIAYYKGNSVGKVSQCFDINEKSLKRWIKRYENGGVEALNDEERSGCPVRLPKEQQQELKKMIEEQNQRVWVARHVYEVLVLIFGVTYSVKYIPAVLRGMGLSYHKAVHVLIKRDNEKRRQWIQEKLPEIYGKKIEEGWRIFYQDEAGVQTDGTLTYTWGPEGEKTEIENYGRHGRVNFFGAFELGTGIFYGIVTSFKINAMRFKRFICHLKHEMRTDKILLICDNAKFHKAKWFTEWVNSQKEWLKLEFLPAYSPDFNPIERVWRWMKKEFIHNRCWKSKKDLRDYLLDIMDKIPLFSEPLKSLMRKENERFEDICRHYEMPFIPQFDFAAQI